ncbi:hypothetical protein MKZ38_001643 [Zalerion maritima]|uniref:DEAD/DEAH box helicase n=1 Tax=Zalerion maritima TaxID=339359 RepID=A0AAD5RPZ9_9PEZI|nr:hypothetical protein MKZ38_001643 [Zalerion maritima]
MQDPGRKEGVEGSASRLLHWYRHLDSRFVDLVGDHAGDEIFILEGDSLLLPSFSDPHLDFRDGLQLLHAVYLVEKLLSDLKRRHCSFVLVFFECHRQLCIPHHVNPEEEEQVQKYLMAREVVIKHLRANSMDSQLVIRCFPAYQDNDFLKFLDDCGAYFIMCHDGSNSSTGVEASAASQATAHEYMKGKSRSEASEPNSDSDQGTDHEDENAPQPRNGNVAQLNHALHFRAMILWFVARSYNVLLLNDIEFQDSRVMVTALELPAEKTPSICPLEFSMEATDEALLGAENFEWIKSVSKMDLGDLSYREMLTIFTLAEMQHKSRLHLESEEDIKYIKAILVHCALLRTSPLGYRVVDLPESTKYSKTRSQTLLTETCRAARQVLCSEAWEYAVASLQPSSCDIADFIDGRCLLAILSQLESGKRIALDTRSLQIAEDLVDALEEVAGFSVDVYSCIRPRSSGEDKPTGPNARNDSKLNKTTSSQRHPRPFETGVLPFSHPVIDPYLASVHVNAYTPKKSQWENPSPWAARIFVELSHWHNHKRPIEPQQKIPPYLLVRQQKMHQRQMAEMRDYAASLTNISGGILKPETIIEGNSHVKPSKGLDKRKTGSVAEKSGGDSGANRRGGKNAAREAASAAAKVKQDKAVEAALSGWVSLNSSVGMSAKAKKNQPTVIDPISAYINSQRYLTKIPNDKREIVLPDVLCYMLQALYTLWKRSVMETSNSTTARPFHIAALCWYVIGKIRRLKRGISSEIASNAQYISSMLGLPSAELHADSTRSLSVNFDGNLSVGNALKPLLHIGLSYYDFQLVHAGPYLDRSMESAPDARVSTFEPDEWQRRVLDQIDKKKSILVVAPTSAGKTFISFYAMQQVLSSDSDGVLVYVAPTKALVNQIAAEVQARFSKQFRHGGKSVWAIHTRDYRINSPTGCQVLVTVPHILQIMLMAPTNAKSWSKRLRYIIFDEVHCIGQAEDGIVWEQLLLMAPCPIIALSATIGNPQAFADWLAATRGGRRGVLSAGKDDDLVMVQHPHRYSDLRKFVYQPPLSFSFQGLQPTLPSLKLGLDDRPGFVFVHPYASLSIVARGIPPDLALEPRDCWTLWQCMKRHQTPDYPLNPSLDPPQSLPEAVRKLDVAMWQGKLDRVLKRWMADSSSPFHNVLADLGNNVVHAKRPAMQASKGLDAKGKENAHDNAKEVHGDALVETTLPLICSLHEQDALPALFFNYNRYECERIAEAILEQLQEAEEEFKNNSAEWSKKLAQWNSWQKRMEDAVKNKKKVSSKKGTSKKVDDDEMGPEDTTRDDNEAGAWAAFDPDDPIDGFHLAGKTMSASRVDFAKHQQKLEWQGTSDWLINALRRGIGVHHAGMNRKYRQICEMLFRSGYLRVVIATGTLALGINMPCKTVVFSGDSIFLSALNFRQAAGRAGRRGFDLLGNVVFQNIPYPRICKLLTSRLPELRGHFPITTSLILRLFSLLHGSGNSTYAQQVISSLLSVPRVYIDGPDESKSTVLHHLRFSIDYLRRNHLLSAGGAPLNFTSIISHLYYQENSAFAFHALLKEGYFHSLGADIVAATEARRAALLRTLMLVMAHLFGRKKIPWSHLEKGARSLSPSIVILPALPQNAKEILCAHNGETRDIFASYVRTFVEQHLEDKPDDRLPFSNMRFGGDCSRRGEDGGDARVEPIFDNARPPTKITSSFVALSGHSDEWDSIGDLCKTVRNGVWLEEAVVPHVPVEDAGKLNAYLYDFYSHGDITALQKGNGIRQSDVWYLLNAAERTVGTNALALLHTDFSMVLATIVTTLNNFLRLSPEADLDVEMINVQGCGDAVDGETADDAYEGMKAGPEQDGEATTGRAKSLLKVKKIIVEDESDDSADVPDSWDAGSSDDSNDDENETSLGANRGFGIGMGESGGNGGNATDDKTGGIMDVLVAFRLLRAEFDGKFKATWA